MPSRMLNVIGCTNSPAECGAVIGQAQYQPQSAIAASFLCIRIIWHLPIVTGCLVLGHQAGGNGWAVRIRNKFIISWVMSSMMFTTSGSLCLVIDLINN